MELLLEMTLPSYLNFSSFQFCSLDGDRWICCGRAGLKQHFCFPKADDKAKQVGCFSNLVDNELESRFHACHEGTVIGKEDLHDQFLDHIGFHSEAMEVKERSVQSIPDVHSIPLVSGSME